MRFLVVSVALFILPLIAHGQGSSAAASKYVGYEYKGVVPDSMLPNGVRSIGGGLIGDINGDPVYEIAQLKKGTTDMMWFNVSTGQDAGGVTGWKVLDVLSFPKLLKTDYLFFYGDPSIECTRNGKDIPNLVGIGRIMRRQAVYRPAKLWIANLTTKKFESVAVAGVKCQYSEP